MTKKTALQLIATVALAAGFIGVSGVGANAATTDDATNKQTTDATVSLTAGDGGDGAHSGTIKLVTAPNMVFGPALSEDGKTGGTPITGASQTIKASSLTASKNSSNELPTGVTAQPGDVTVVNAGSTDPWNVTVQASDFTGTGTTATDKTLLGATINLKGSAVSANGNTDNAAIAAQPAVTAGGDAVQVLSATAGNGIGTWANRLTTDSDLTIQGGNSAGTYASTLTWTIADTASTQA
ncbi:MULTISPECIES: WxL domain-containing protein [Lactobacillaceae]|uniref:WxL domain-containing protein n=1 Tax=Lactobacillaceae TaxID=33958 RepID=UPI0014565503|nr:WxL domain-containing protein [Lactobacillus sp. HBUAS51381]NLR08923.1 hypothetical protein [Lactobacillus sp. HBUAS51381]